MISLPVSELSTISDIDEIIDVRSPSEFEEDHFPGAINLPVLDDTQRAHIGTRYVQNSTFDAKREGAALITANISTHLTNHFADKPRSYRPAIYCWRGGQRSRSLATILAAIGWKTHLVEGGYKAIRREVIQDIESIPPKLQWIALNGLTGTGKTRILHVLRDNGHQILDLEGLANHKGSLLGLNPASPQPSQKAFESILWHALRQLSTDRPTLVEAESRKVGNVHIPNALWDCMTQSQVIEIQLPTPARIDHLKSEYLHFLQDAEFLKERLSPLRKRYGNTLLDQWEQLADSGDWDALVQSLLVDHYDTHYSNSTRYPDPENKISLDNLDEAEILSKIVPLITVPNPSAE